MTKRLYRSRTSKVLEGVCGGVGEYFDVDPVLIRLLYLMATVFTGFVPGIIGYIIAMFVVPEAPKIDTAKPATPPAHDSAAV
jgi:phage shock protein C